MSNGLNPDKCESPNCSSFFAVDAEKESEDAFREGLRFNLSLLHLYAMRH